jgi:elongation factor Ts
MINADLVKELRDKTDAPISACKKALEKAEGDMSKALEFLKEEGARIAEKKAERVTEAGLVEAYIHGQKIGALLELKSETDFVSRNPDFKHLAHEIAMHIAAANPESVEALLQQPFIKDDSKTIANLIQDATARFGEKIELTRFARFEL